MAHRIRARHLGDLVEQLEAEREAVYTNQSRVAEQLKVLGEAGEEGRVRQRTVASLVSLQDREAALDAEIDRTKAAVAADLAAAEDQLAGLVRE